MQEGEIDAHKCRCEFALMASTAADQSGFVQEALPGYLGTQ